MEEIWKEYKKFGKDRNGNISCIVTDLKISNLGNVTGNLFNHKEFNNNMITINKSGHRCIGGTEIYKLVYELFVGEVEKGNDIHHEDENKLNDKLNNLISIPHSLHMKIHHKNKIVSEETRIKMSNWQKGKPKPHGILKWYNNGTENKVIKIGEQIPDGFVPGMLKKNKKQ